LGAPGVYAVMWLFKDLGGGAQPDSYFFVGVNVHSLFNACELRSVGCTLAGGQSIVVAWVVPVCNASLLL
jgi:hypothetical protein